MADWNSLPRELISLIADGFSAIEDLASLTSVCRSFRCAVDTNRWRPKVASRSPWLLLCCQNQCGDDDDELVDSERGLLSMYKNNKKFYMNLPELRGRHCWGSANGWVITLGLDLQLHLFNPLSSRRILLPPLTYQKEWDERNQLPWDDEEKKAKWIRRLYIDRALIIKRPPSSYASSFFDDFLVITTGGLGELRVVRPYTWASVKFTRGHGPGYVFDLACHNGQIYMLGNRGLLYLCSNFDGPDPPRVEEYLPINESLDGSEKYYLVESSGDLLMVVRYIGDFRSSVQPRHTTYCFDVFKLDHKNKKWVELDDLGDRALFVGDCQSLALCRPEDFNCRRNCIYFTDDLYERFYVVDGKGKLVDDKGGRDMGVYDYKDHTIKPVYEGLDSLSFYSTPNWFIPSFV